MKVGTLEIKVTEKAFRYLEELLATGFYGFDVADVASRLVDEGIRREMKAGVSIEHVAEQMKCKACGSPKIGPPLTMSGNDLECQDCGAAYL